MRCSYFFAVIETHCLTWAGPMYRSTKQNCAHLGVIETYLKPDMLPSPRIQGYDTTPGSSIQTDLKRTARFLHHGIRVVRWCWLVLQRSTTSFHQLNGHLILQPSSNFCRLKKVSSPVFAAGTLKLSVQCERFEVSDEWYQGPHRSHQDMVFPSEQLGVSKGCDPWRLGVPIIHSLRD